MTVQHTWTHIVLQITNALHLSNFTVLKKQVAYHCVYGTQCSVRSMCHNQKYHQKGSPSFRTESRLCQSVAHCAEPAVM